MILINVLGTIMGWCYKILGNYGWAIILFTLFSKIILLPMSIWVQKNSIKMVKMQPSINKIKIDFFGDKDKIAEEQDKLYKREKYNAFASLIPLIIQILLLVGLVQVINHPLTYIIKIPNDYTEKFIAVALENHQELESDSSSLQLIVVNDIKNGKIEKYEEVCNDNKIINNIEDLKLNFAGFDLSWIATQKLGMAIWIPILAGFSALLLCIAQNIMNVLQAEQSNVNKYGMMIISVGLSLYLGAFVPAGVALYWIASNLFAILQQWLLNIFIDPKKTVDYEELEKTRNELKELSSNKGQKRSKEERKKEKEDYKKFFKVVNKHLVIYSESNGFYKYFKNYMEYILANTNMTIHYITSDYNDNIFKLEKENSKIRAYYIGEKRLITLMMKMDADVVLMTMPDLENYHIKRSYLRKDINYIYVPHGMDSINLTMREKSINHFDTVFMTGKHQTEEQEKTNEVYGIENRKIVNAGYTLLDDMIKEYNNNKTDETKKSILIAPSWQKDNIIDLCLEDILNKLIDSDYQIIVRPHPQHVKHAKEKFEMLKEKYNNNKNIIIQTDFSSNSSVFNASLLITDWSAIAQEYAFTTKKPVIFIDTPMKIMNPEYKKINVEPFNIWSRNEIGRVIELDKINNVKDVIDDTFEHIDDYKEKIANMVDEYVYNLGTSAEFGAKYIIEVIQEKINERKKEN